MNLTKFIPIFNWAKNYQKHWLKKDISAGLIVGIMLIPQGMAYALIAGLPAVYGLYASIVPLIIYAIFGTSRQLAVGPVAMVSLLTASALGGFSNISATEYIQYAILLALLVGIIQFLLGVFRLGFLVNFLSHPVISGFTSAAALIIGLSQLKHILGVNIPRTHHIHEIIINAMKQSAHINWIAVAIGVLGIILILAVKYFNKKYNKGIPGQLIAVIFGILVVYFFKLESQGVKIVKDIPSELPGLAIPILSIKSILLLLPLALTISIVSFMESIAVAKSIQAKHRNYKLDNNQELIALGLANIVGSFFKSYPTTGGFSRTAVNDQAGAKSGFASIISALLIVTTLLFLTPLFYNLPKAILASIIMVAVVGLIDFKEAKHLWLSDKKDFLLLIITFIATLSLGIEKGIGLGVILSLVMMIFRTTRPHLAILGKVPGTHFYRNVKRFDNLEEEKNLLIIRFDAQMYFANTNYFKDKVDKLVTNKGLEHVKLVVIDGESTNSIDSTAIHMFAGMVDEYAEHNIEVCFTGIKGPVRDAMHRAGFVKKIGENHFFMSIQEAVDCYLNECAGNDKSSNGYKDYTMQVN